MRSTIHDVRLTLNVILQKVENAETSRSEIITVFMIYECAPCWLYYWLGAIVSQKYIIFILWTNVLFLSHISMFS